MFPCPPLAYGLTAPCILAPCSPISVSHVKLNGLLKFHKIKAAVNLPVNAVLSQLSPLVVPVFQHFINQSYLLLSPFLCFVLSTFLFLSLLFVWRLAGEIHKFMDLGCHFNWKPLFFKKDNIPDMLTFSNTIFWLNLR